MSSDIIENTLFNRIHDFDYILTGIQGDGLGLETVAVCHEKHFLILVVPEAQL